MRTRWLVLLAGLSLAANVLFATALVQAKRSMRQQRVSGVSPVVMTFCDEEKRLREDLASLLCATPPDREAIGTALARLDTIRAEHRERALGEWLSSCERASEGDRAALESSFRHQMCPWQHEGEGCCAPSPRPGTPNPKPAQPNL